MTGVYTNVMLLRLRDEGKEGAREGRRDGWEGRTPCSERSSLAPFSCPWQ